MENSKIAGIKCNVTSCIYNKDKEECVAGKIDVTNCGCTTPNCSAQTECKTFKPRVY